MALSSELIRQIAERLQEFPVDERRAAELADEVARLNRTVLDLYGEIDFNNDPAGFRALLERYAR